jgi:putative Holliday junction resolvase
MRVMALDVGERTVGIAVSDELGISTSPRETLRRGTDEIERLARMVESEGIGTVVVGLPLSLSGQEGPSCRLAREFAGLLAARVTVPVVTWDERLTTAEAERALISANVRRAKRRTVIDQVAASLILQSYLRAKSS